MRSGMYAKIAADNLKKNHRLYIPYILSGAGLLACFYIIYNLAGDERLLDTRGGTFLTIFMGFGTVVMALLSAILIFYTNSFLMKQRKREYGLYNVLGMEKRHIGRILFYEALFSEMITLLLGIGVGILFYKLCTLIICRLLHVDSVLGLYFLKTRTILLSMGFFMVLYLLAYMFNRRSIRKIKPVELLKSANMGEKEPKVKWLLLVIGTACLGTGYVLALTVKNALLALNVFFTAVILVIIGTYFLFTAGSIFVLKMLKKNPKYYYTKRHMPAVSGLMYRMKQNAIGLASITILACGVLVMVSSTVCLYAGVQDTLKQQYKHQIQFGATYTEDNIVPDKEFLVDVLDRSAENIGAKLAYAEEERYLQVSFAYVGDEFSMDRDNGGIQDLITVFFITADDYREMTGTDLHLEPNEVAVSSISINANMHGDTFRLGDELFHVQKLDYFPFEVGLNELVPTFGMIVDSEETFETIDQIQHEGYGKNASEQVVHIVADLDRRHLSVEEAERFYENAHEMIKAAAMERGDKDTGCGMMMDTVWDLEFDLYSMYGTLLFLGMILALVFMFAAVLIIYYKQISEGYEDRARFQIMEKVGMSRREVKETIRHQILLIFFLPLIAAGIHIAVAFRLILQMMKIMMLTNVGLFVGCAIGTYIVFALIYSLIYTLTAKTYYKIVY